MLTIKKNQKKNRDCFSSDSIKFYIFGRKQPLLSILQCKEKMGNVNSEPRSETKFPENAQEDRKPHPHILLKVVGSNCQ